jgi:Ca-activated chloride channel family protein
MKNFLALLFLFISLPILAYQVYSPEDYSYEKNGDNLLFVLDFSNSMGEYLEHKTKAVQVKEMMSQILPQISSDTKIGVRVYGHTCNIFAYNACRSSELIVPINTGNADNIINSISKLRPRGMTPITYSLKQAVKKDFVSLGGNKHIILLTDGGENCDESPCDYAISLAKSKSNIKIDVIAFNVQESDDLAQLKCTADVTGGKLIETNTNAELINSMQEMILPHKQVRALLYGAE